MASSSGRQPNFAALNRGRHLYSAGRPSRWALTHISSLCMFSMVRIDNPSLLSEICNSCSAIFTNWLPFINMQPTLSKHWRPKWERDIIVPDMFSNYNKTTTSISTAVFQVIIIKYEVQGSRPRGRPKRTWKEVVQKDYQARTLNKEDAMDRGRWKKLIKIGWWSGWWVGECFFWYRLTQVVPDKGP